MNSGKIFETNFRNSVDKSKTYYLRLKDSPSAFGQDSSKVRFTADNPYDNFCFYEQSLFPLELKNSKSTSFSFQKDKKEKGKNIKLNQIKGLLEANKYKGIYAGFLFNFDKENSPTVWMSIDNFYKFYTETNKKSINFKDMQNYGCIIVDKHIKKVNYHYEVEKLLDDILKIEGGNKIAEEDFPESDSN